MIEVPLTHGFVARIDETDLALVSRYKWRVEPRKHTNYAVTSVGRTPVRMHALLLGTVGQKHKKVSDHWDGDGLNNQRINLRKGSQGQNCFNSGPKKKGTHKGVTFQKRLTLRPWQSRIAIEGEQIHLGYFPTAEEAAAVYDDAAIRLHKDFALLNGVSAIPSDNCVRKLISHEKIRAKRGHVIRYAMECGHYVEVRYVDRQKMGKTHHCQICKEIV